MSYKQYNDPINGKPIGTCAYNHAGFNHGPIIDSLINGQFKQAKSQTLIGCKTRPEKLAYRVGSIVGALIENGKPDLAVKFLNLFNN